MHKIELFARKVLKQLIDSNNYGLKENSSKELLQVDLSIQPYKITINSDDLSLDNKIAIEKAFTTQNKQQKKEYDFRLHFKRKTPKPVTTRKIPFDPTVQRSKIPGVKTIVAIASGKGGVGKSTLSTNLACSLAQQGYKTGLLDLDLYGPSTQHLLSAASKTYTDWGMNVNNSGKLQPLTCFNVTLASLGLLTATTTPTAWRGPLASKAVSQLALQVEWPNLDILIVDTPPGTSDIHLTLLETIALNSVIIITTPQQIALLDAHKAVNLCAQHMVDIFGVVLNMSDYICSNCGHHDDIFDSYNGEKFALQYQLPLLAKLPLSKQLRQQCDDGMPLVLAKPHHVISKQIKGLADTVAQKLLPTTKDHHNQAVSINN